MWRVYILIELKDGSLFFEDFFIEAPDCSKAIHEAFDKAMIKYFYKFNHIACCGKRSAKLLSRELHAL